MLYRTCICDKHYSNIALYITPPLESYLPFSLFSLESTNQRLYRRFPLPFSSRELSGYVIDITFDEVDFRVISLEDSYNTIRRYARCV